MTTPALYRIPLAMIARTWTARATPTGAEAYVRFFEHTLMPQLGAIEGHQGAIVMKRACDDGAIEITVLTFWGSMDAVARFAGADIERAVVEPEAGAMLLTFDEAVKHHEVMVQGSLCNTTCRGT